MKPCIAVALSGGVDSLVAAYLLKEQGVTVIGLHFITGFESSLKPEKYPDERDTEIKPSEILKTDTKKDFIQYQNNSIFQSIWWMCRMSFKNALSIALSTPIDRVKHQIHA
jgi:tRNA(Ile)-lysidine synthase TilS/MesJ